MEVLDSSHSHWNEFSMYEENNNHEKTYVTVNADSYNEKDFDNLLNCLDKIHESETKRQNRKVIKNYCVQVPYIDNSIAIKDDAPSRDEIDESCDKMRSNISQMFSYFDEDINLDYDEYDESNRNYKKCASKVKKRKSNDSNNNNDEGTIDSQKMNSLSESYREKFLRNRNKIERMSEAQKVDTRPIICGAIKKPNAPPTPNTSLNKNQVDKIINEFNRVKINYYSKENYVEFTNIDYFYCDSDMDSICSEKVVGKLKEKFDTEKLGESDRKSSTNDIEVVPKNSVRDKINMFTKLDTIIKPCDGPLRNSLKTSVEMTKKEFRKENEMKQKQQSQSVSNIIKNTSAANKNQNKCFIKDVNNSLLHQVEKDDKLEALKEENEDIFVSKNLLDKISSHAHLHNIDLLMKLERIVNKFNMSLLHTINSLATDDAFGSCLKHLDVETRPSFERFDDTFNNKNIETVLENVELSTIDAHKIRLQMQVILVNTTTGQKDCSANVNVIFMAKYETDHCVLPPKTSVIDDNNYFIYFTSLFEPPENELQKARESNVVLSEHQLRVQASLQKLNIPDWYKQYSSNASHNTSANTSYYNKNDVTGLLRKRNSDIGRWQGLSSKTTSLSSLGSNRSDRSPVMLSPSAHSHTGGPSTGFSRWSTSHLNSSQTSPSVSARSSFVRNSNYNSSTMSGQSVTSSQAGDIRSSYRKPYLGWRSQEKLAQPRTPHERLASSMMSQQKQSENQQQKLQQPIASSEIQSSIKEVTSAIVHYVNDQTNRGSRSRSVSPSTRCWLESSFVGTKPLESPQTPATENSFVHGQKINIGPMSVTATNYDSIRINGISADAQESTAFVSSYYPSVKSSATSLEEEVILSLLGLPSDMHKSSSEDLANQPNYRGLSTFSTFKPAPVPAPAATQPKQPQPPSSSSQLAVEHSSHSRRHSEGDAQRRLMEHHSQDYEDEKSDEVRPLINRGASSTSTSPAPQYRRVSLDSSDANHGDLLRCRYPRCDNAATVADAKKNYKSCHNCTHLYCSRDCRRNHWERGHRRACLHSRVSVLCRQVLSACKDDPDTLKHLSLLARRGFLAQGRGVVRLLFRSPENADLFIKQGFQFLGEVSYVRWPDLLPSEMGPELYSELLRLSTEYKPDGKMLIYVAICVVSEAPSSSTAPVKWERQLVSRCAKLKLCKSIISDKSLFTSANASTQVIKHEFDTDVLILTFNATDKSTQKSREIIMANVQHTLQQKGINLRKHFPEVFQRLSNYAEGISSFLPVTIHPRDNNTGRSFVCIIFPQNGDAEKFKLPPKQETGDHVQTIDVGIERIDEIMLTHNSLNDDLFTEGTKF